MEEALSQHESRALAPEVARTLLERGMLQRRAKQKNAAKRSLEQALTMYKQIGAPMWVQRCQDGLSRIGLRRAAVTEGLTPAQQRVAGLVAAGMTNREVAGTLYMSLRSVESHLTKVYRELGVKSRSQLVAALKAGGSRAEDARDPRSPRRAVRVVPPNDRQKDPQGEPPARGAEVDPVAHADERPARRLDSRNCFERLVECGRDAVESCHDDSTALA